jgi:hypothetical protein
MKKTYFVDTWANIRRTTEREYTHAVIAYNEGYKPEDDPDAYAIGFCGSLELAQKSLAQRQSEQARGWYSAQKRFAILPVQIHQKGHK